MNRKQIIKIVVSVLIAALTALAADQAAFLEQKDLAGGKKTLKAYYWKICGDAYDESLANG